MTRQLTLEEARPLLDAAEARELGHWTWRLRIAWRYRHDATSQGQRRTRRLAVLDALGWLRGMRQTVGERTPILPDCCGDVGTLESRHVWGPEGPDVTLCACGRCMADRGGSA